MVPQVSDSAERRKVLSQMGDPASLRGLEKQFLADSGTSMFYGGYTNPQGQFPVRLMEARPIELVVGDELADAEQPPSELLLKISVADVASGEGIAVEVNGARVSSASLERTEKTSFAALAAKGIPQTGPQHHCRPGRATTRPGGCPPG